MNSARLRMIAGPNGSGKSTLVDYLRSLNVPLGHYLNADEIDVKLANSGRLDLRDYAATLDAAEFPSFAGTHPLAVHQNTKLSVQDTTILLDGPFRPGYLSAIISDYLRKQLIGLRQSFTFETVMSGSDKISLLQDVRAAGYRTYTYFVCTNTPLINQERVAARVASGGHNVPEDKIVARYHRSLSLLPEAIRLSNRAYLFDNSLEQHRFVAEFEDGRLIQVNPPLPAWFITAWVNKQISSH